MRVEKFGNSVYVAVPRGCVEVVMGRVKSYSKLVSVTNEQLTRLNRLARENAWKGEKQRGPARGILERYGKRLFREMRNYVSTAKSWDTFFESTTERVAITVDEETALIPWELAHDGNDFLCTRYKVTRRIQLPVKWVGGFTPFEARTRNALVIGLNYKGRYELDYPEMEAHAVASRLKGLGYKLLNGEPLTGSKATVANVSKLLRNEKEPLAVLHFTGHSSGGKLPLADGSLSGRDLAETFSKTHGAPFLTFLNACSTNQFDRTGLVKAVAAYGGEQIIASFWSIFDDASTRFADVFYHQVELGYPVPDAVYSARMKLRGDIGRYDDTWPAFVAYGAEFPAKYRVEA